MSHTSIGILTVIPEGGVDSPAPTAAIILEGTMVMDDLENLPMPFAFSFLHPEPYPQLLNNTFDFIQRVLLSFGCKSLKPKIQSLKNPLLQWVNVFHMWIWSDMLGHVKIFTLLLPIKVFTSAAEAPLWFFLVEGSIIALCSQRDC